MFIELTREHRIPILYEDRSVLAIDKPAGWMLVPVSWQKTDRNLQAAIISSIAAGHFWAKSRNLKYLKNIHRLDTDTTGVMLFAKSQGALETFSELFESRKMQKTYLAVIDKAPPSETWVSRESLAPEPDQIGKIIVSTAGKAAETEFRVAAKSAGKYLIECKPYTGRTHQIRVHLAHQGCPIIGDKLYGGSAGVLMQLRAIALAYTDPFIRRPIQITAPLAEFLKSAGFPEDSFSMLGNKIIRDKR